jgi:hypothetical protein
MAFAVFICFSRYSSLESLALCSETIRDYVIVSVGSSDQAHPKRAARHQLLL